MRAMQLRAPRPIDERPLELVELQRPQPGPGEILIRVSACGVCRTDLHICEGELPPHKSPVVPGHQIVGRVAELGEGADRFAVGDRVGVPWLRSTDGTCRFCRRGDENLCDNARFTGWDADGGYAEFMTAPAAFSYGLHEDLSDLAAAPLLCAGLIGYRSLRLSNLVPWGHGKEAAGGPPGPGAAAGRRIGLYGFGAAAHICLQVARYWGAEVYAFTREERHRQLARDLGAVWAGDAGQAPGDDPSIRLDSAIVFAPVGELMLEALKVLDKGGTVADAGIYSTPIPAIDYPLLYGERVVRSVTNLTRRDAAELLELAATIPVTTEIQVFALEQANDALIALKHDGIRGAAVLQVASE
ncbi:MAG TPA: zinc-dependent alcohol dehydrogenase family protein [Thermoleophilia bacterium]|nr:zinc-dependent alcohol dehydrogenase family protein [Thermoleophilia bacterium]